MPQQRDSQAGASPPDAGEGRPLVLSKPLTDLAWPTHARAGNLIYSAHRFKCCSCPETPRMMFEQRSEHLMAQPSLHVKQAMSMPLLSPKTYSCSVLLDPVPLVCAPQCCVSWPPGQVFSFFDTPWGSCRAPGEGRGVPPLLPPPTSGSSAW